MKAATESLQTFIYVLSVVLLTFILLQTAVTYRKVEVLEDEDLLIQWASKRPIIFIGDSVTRYMYIHMAYRLVHGVYHHESANFSTNSTKRIIAEADYESWEKFHHHVNKELRHETADTYHNGWPPRIEDLATHIIENRYYSDPKNYIKMAYYMVFSDIGTCITKGRLGYEAKGTFFEGVPDWCFSIANLLENVYETYGDAMIVFNMGLHKGDKLKSARALREFSRGTGKNSIVIWRETTPHRGFGMAEGKNRTNPVYDLEIFNILAKDVHIWKVWDQIVEIVDWKWEDFMVKNLDI